MILARTPLPQVLRLLADPTRLRILALLEREEVTVGELSRALGMAQSRVSNHLRHLREAGLLQERRLGTQTWLRLAPSESAPRVERLWSVVREEVAELPECAADRARLAAVLARRREREGDFFDRVAGEWDKIAGAFETGQARQRALVHLVPPRLVVADLGCGTGYVAEALLGVAARVIAVDRSEGMLAQARERLLADPRGTEVELRRGELDRLPIRDGECHACVAGMVLHHIERPERAVAEMARVLAPAGTAVVLELEPHKEGWMRRELGDLHLGLDPREVLDAFRGAGFEDVVLDPVADRYQPRRPDGEPVSLALYVVRGRLPADAGAGSDARTKPTRGESRR